MWLPQSPAAPSSNPPAVPHYSRWLPSKLEQVNSYYRLRDPAQHNQNGFPSLTPGGKGPELFEWQISILMLKLLRKGDVLSM